LAGKLQHDHLWLSVTENIVMDAANWRGTSTTNLPG
jgi:hypothetical protein